MKNKAKAKDLEFISWIKRDGSGTEKVPDEMLENMLNSRFCKDDKFKLNVLSLSNKTFIASGFNSFVVKLKNK
jgi:hypothetical protein